jgi:hypothetical protein
VEPDLVTAGVDQLEDRLGGQRAAAKEDMGLGPRPIQHLQDDLELLKVAESLDPGEIEIGAKPAEHVPQEWALAIGTIDVDANDQSHRLGREICAAHKLGINLRAAVGWIGIASPGARVDLVACMAIDDPLGSAQ